MGPLGIAAERAKKCNKHNGDNSVEYSSYNVGQQHEDEYGNGKENTSSCWSPSRRRVGAHSAQSAIVVVGVSKKEFLLKKRGVK